MNQLSSDDFPKFEVGEPKAEAHGDFSTNAAMVMAKTQKMAPRKIAEVLIAHIEDVENSIIKTEIAGPGFINFFIEASAWMPVLAEIHAKDTMYGASTIGNGEKVQLEFVSANPTGPLHVGHGRGAAVGDSMAAIMAFCGFDVVKEYYINDSGRQIRTLGTSVYLRYQEIHDIPVDFPDDCYQGDYIWDLARAINEKKGAALLEKSEEEAISECARYAASHILDGIKHDLRLFGVTFDNWYSEQSLFDSGKVDAVLAELKKRHIIYEKDGAFWFRTSDYGDEKDRVVIRNNGLTTYFASDIAYHRDKFDRGFQRIIDVWGADHHGYIPRISASVEASGADREKFNVILIQLVNLLRGGEPVAMSTRSGEFDTLSDVITEVGKDAARFLFLTRHHESPLDFDLDLAKKKTDENPVFYVQYVHARISSIFKKAAQENVLRQTEISPESFRGILTVPEEIVLIKTMARFSEVLGNCVRFMEPHRLTFYLKELASAFHAYYNKHRVLTDDPLVTQARLYLIHAVRKVIRNGLSLLGVSAPDQM